MPGYVRSFLLIALAAGVSVPLAYLVKPWVGWSVFCSSLVLQLVFQLRNFARLDRWSRAPFADTGLDASGLWGGVFARIYRHEKDLNGQIGRGLAQVDMLIAAAQALNDGVVLLDRRDAIEFCNTTGEMQLGLDNQCRPRPTYRQSRAPAGICRLSQGR